MKTRNLLLALGCAAALTACTNNEEPVVAPAADMRTVTLSVDVNEPADTRITYTKEESTYKFGWHGTETIRVFYNDGTEKFTDFTIIDGSINGKVAKFEGKLPSDYQGDVTIVFAGADLNYKSGSDNEIVLSDYAGKTTNVAGDLAKRTLLYAKTEVTEAGKLPDVKLNHLLAYLLLKAGLQVTQDNLTIGEGDSNLILGVGTSRCITFSSNGGAVPDNAASEFRSVYVTNGKLVNDCLVPLYVREGSTAGYAVAGYFSGYTGELSYSYQPEFTYEPGKIYVVEADNEKWLPVTVTTSESSDKDPLTLEALEDGKISFNNKVDAVTYKINGADGGTIAANAVTEFSVAKGDKVQFFGKNKTYSGDISSSDSQYFSNIACEGSFYIYGNIMSLFDGENFTLTPTTSFLSNSYYTFAGLFKNNTNIQNHPTKDIVLPATKVTQRTYCSLFEGCTGITRAPELPATTLEYACYENMFKGSGIIEAPELPATELTGSCYLGMFMDCKNLTKAPKLSAMEAASSCYNRMFQGCTNLTTAPDLPATTVNSSSYYYMFSGCTSLIEVPSELPATTLAESSYLGMFEGCTSLKSAPALLATTLAKQSCMSMFKNCVALVNVPADQLPAMTLAVSCYQRMYAGCTSLTTAPDLKAEKLVDSCYDEMFNGCSKLSAVTCLATSFDNQNCTYIWLKDVATEGTFTKAKGADWSSRSWGIPSNWEVEEVEI